MAPNRRPAPKLAPTLVATFLALLLVVDLCWCQVTDGDEQFQAVHQDIGRISGSPSASSVAPQSTITLNRQPVVEPAHQHQPAQVFVPAPRARAHATPAAPRKPSRVTLAVRRDPLPTRQSAAAAAAALEPAPQPVLVPAQLPAPQAAPLEPTFAPLAPPPPSALQQPAPSASFVDHQTGPALASFRSVVAAPQQAVSGGVSARHSALMAQVAAERAAAADLSGGHALGHSATEHQFEPSSPAPLQQPSLGSPIEALSSPSVAQVLAPARAHAATAAAATSAAIAPAFVDRPEEPLVAPSFEHVLSNGCPHKGVFSYENKDHCDRYYMCTNGTFTEEACPNGLAYSQMGAVYQHCAYNWNVDCGRKKTAEPISSPGCPWQFGIFPIVSNGRCSIDYYACEWGVPETKRCSPEGLFYDDSIKGCQWADQLGCKSEGLLNFKCPSEDEDNPYWPYPRYYHNTQDVIVCVNEQPRLVHCNEEQLVDPSSLACVDVKKKKKKF